MKSDYPRERTKMGDESFALIAAGAAGVFSNRAQALREAWRLR